LKLKLTNYMQGFKAMRSRKSFPAALVGIIAAVMAVPAQANAESFPDKASNYVSDHTGYFVAALLAAILLLLLIVRITQRRAKEKEKKQPAQAGVPPVVAAPGAAGPPPPPPGAAPAVAPATAEIAAVPGIAPSPAQPPAPTAAQPAPPPGPAIPPPAPGQAQAPANESGKERKRRVREEQRAARAQMRDSRRAELQRRKEERAQRRGQKKGKAAASPAPAAAPGAPIVPEPEVAKPKKVFGITLGSRKKLREAEEAEQRLAAARAASEQAVAEAQATGEVPPSGQLTPWEEGTVAQPPTGEIAAVPSVPPAVAPGGAPATGEYDPAAAEQRVRDKVAEVRQEQQRIGAEADRRLAEAEQLQQGGPPPVGAQPIQDTGAATPVPQVDLKTAVEQKLDANRCQDGGRSKRCSIRYHVGRVVVAEHPDRRQQGADEIEVRQ